MFSRYLNFYPNFFDDVVKQLDKKATVNFKIYDITDWETNNKNTYIVQYLKSEDNYINKFVQLIEYIIGISFFEKSYTKCDDEAVSDSFRKK